MYKLKLIFILITIICVFNKNTKSQEYTHWHGGFSIGIENIFGLKFGYFDTFSNNSSNIKFKKPKSTYPRSSNLNNKIYNESYYCFYLSFFGMNEYILSASSSIGYKFNHFTIENALTQSSIIKYDDKPIFWTTTNPKLGLYFKPVWLKAGPSVILLQNQEFKTLNTENLFKFNNIYFSFDLLFFF